MRDDLNAAVDDLDDASDLDETPQVVESVDDTDDGVVAESDTDTIEAEGAAESTDTDKKEGAEGDKQFSSAEAAADAPSDSSDDKPTDSLKAPVGWSPKEREQWSKVPRELQERISAREREMVDSMAGTKEARQAYEQINQVAQSFGPVLAADGYSNPVEAMQAAFGSMAAMRMGTPEQKAQEVARIIQQYGIDINALDQVLVGNAPEGGYQQADPQQASMERMLEQKLAPMQEFMQTVGNIQSQQQNAGRQQAADGVKEFAKSAEFIADVREDMADIIDLSAKRGVKLTLQQAYDRAVQAHPEISQVLTERARNEAITGGKSLIASKRNAASSISGRQTGTGGGPSSLSMRDEIAAAFDEAASG
jgi:hypothetical protein